MATIFISYRREDSAGYAGRLHEELQERLGAGHVFRDVDTLQPGQDFATFNASLNRNLEGELIRDLSMPTNAQAQTVAETTNSQSRSAPP